jgi:hypothetical protein
VETPLKVLAVVTVAAKRVLVNNQRFAKLRVKA